MTCQVIFSAVLESQSSKTGQEEGVPFDSSIVHYTRIYMRKICNKRVVSELKAIPKKMSEFFSFAPLMTHKDLWHSFNKALWHMVS